MAMRRLSGWLMILAVLGLAGVGQAQSVLLSTHGFITPESLPPRVHGLAQSPPFHLPDSDLPSLGAMVDRYVERRYGSAGGAS